MQIKLAIFDFDGTILDTQKPIVLAKKEAMKELSLIPASDEECIATIGLTAKLGFKKMYPDLTDEMLDECVKRFRLNFERIKDIVPPVLFANVIETLEALKKNGIVCTIATSRNRKSLMSFLKTLNLEKYFSYILAGEDTPLLKPNPDPVLKTLNDLSYSKEEAIVIGDMPYDILMGKNAGVLTCGVTYGNATLQELKDCGADFVIDDMGELLGVL